MRLVWTIADYRERLQSQAVGDRVKHIGNILKEEQVVLLLTFKNASSYYNGINVSPSIDIYVYINLYVISVEMKRNFFSVLRSAIC